MKIIHLICWSVLILQFVTATLGKKKVGLNPRVNEGSGSRALFTASGEPTPEHDFWVNTLGILDNTDSGDRLTGYQSLTASKNRYLQNWAPVFGNNEKRLGYTGALKKLAAQVNSQAASMHEEQLNHISDGANSIASDRRGRVRPGLEYAGHNHVATEWENFANGVRHLTSGSKGIGGGEGSGGGYRGFGRRRRIVGGPVRGIDGGQDQGIGGDSDRRIGGAGAPGIDAIRDRRIAGGRGIRRDQGVSGGRGIRGDKGVAGGRGIRGDQGVSGGHRMGGLEIRRDQGLRGSRRIGNGPAIGDVRRIARG